MEQRNGNRTWLHTSELKIQRSYNNHNVLAVDVFGIGTSQAGLWNETRRY